MTRELQAATSDALRGPERETPVKLWDGPPLQGDDYPLEYYEDGFPKLPAFLDRRAVKGAIKRQER